jgi:hypothetical protein
MRRLLAFGILAILLGVTAPAWSQTASATVAADSANVRDKASMGGSVVSVVSKGDQVEILEKSGTWYRVRLKSGQEGFVPAAYLTVTGAAATTTPAATSATAAAAPAAAAATSASASESAGQTGGDERKYSLRAYGGLESLSGYSTGFGGVAGAAFRPFPMEELEVAVDGMFFHHGGVSSDSAYYSLDTSANIYGGSGAVLYNFKTPSLKFSPYAGAGLTFRHISLGACVVNGIDLGCSASDTSFMGVGGIQLPISDRRAFRAEVRFASDTIYLLAGISF